MYYIIKFISGFLLCLLVFSIVTSFLSNLFNFGKMSLGGIYNALSIFLMTSPAIFGYYCIQYFLQYKNPEWNRKPEFILVYICIALFYSFVFGIVGLIGTRNHFVEQNIGMVVASGVTYMVLRESFHKL